MRPRAPMLPAGQVFHYLTIVEYLRQCNGHPVYSCQCHCGKLVQVSGNSLKKGRTKSCGCWKNGQASARLITHGHTKGDQYSLEYRAWCSMRIRCKEDPNYLNVQIAEEWRGIGGFERFFAHLGPKPSEKHTLDRIKNDRGYVPGNVRWATAAEQSRNKTTNVWVEINGQRKVLKDWATELGISYKLAHGRIRHGWDPVKALLTPPDVKKRNKRIWPKKQPPQSIDRP